MRTTKMLIGEVVSDDLLKQIVAHMKEHIATIPGLVSHSILVEEGGRMVILITDWPNRQDCVTYHSSRVYRQFLAGTQHMLVGDYVVKLFILCSAEHNWNYVLLTVMCCWCRESRLHRNSTPRKQHIS
jgi:hypothetical protein